MSLLARLEQRVRDCGEFTGPSHCFSDAIKRGEINEHTSH